jgi:hypothetical protein
LARRPHSLTSAFLIMAVPADLSSTVRHILTSLDFISFSIQSGQLNFYQEAAHSSKKFIHRQNNTTSQLTRQIPGHVSP